MKRLINFFKRLRKIPKKYWFIAGVIILIVLKLTTGRSKPAQLQFAQVKRQDIQSQISASGILSGKNMANLRFKMGGKMVYLAVQPGDTVKKGQVIATLDNQELSIALQQAQNNRRNTQAQVDNIHDQVQGKTTTQTFADIALRTNAEVANDNAWDNLRAAQRAFQDTVIISPISGVVVGQDNIAQGQNVAPSDLIAQIVDFSQKDFSADVDESDIGKVALGQIAQVTLNAYGDKIFNGKVVEIFPQAKTSSSGATTVTVKIELTDPAIHPIYGLNGQANIVVLGKQNVLTILQEAIVGENEVYIKNSHGKIERRTIELGIKSDIDAEVTLGLAEGDTIVLNPQAVAQK